MNRKAEDIFVRALELPPEERGSFLDAECGDDASLRTEVEEWLSDAERADTFFAELTRGASGVPSPSGHPGEWVGPYKLLQKIGEGGFGVVWMAEQETPIRRRVAVKVIKAGMDTEEVLSRFAAERQALARMEHPNIARVLDAGATAAGRPYFAMELVAGVPITRFCDEHLLGGHERLRLFMDVCAAVNHAHQKGLIHRDIKPSNVLVTLDGDKPAVKVIDFGVAKATEGRLTEHTFHTRFEQLVGTPAYMSPEQAGLGNLDIDTRSDVYSLGVLLYELLTGVAPFDQKTLLQAGYEEMRRIIREVEPARPSARLTSLGAEKKKPIAAARRIPSERLHREISSELDWIVMKAIDKARDRRYETADALAKDVANFIADKPVNARPPGAAYLLGKFVRRNRALSGFLLLLVAATAVSAWLALRATRAEKLAGSRLAEAVGERNAKDRALQDAEAVSKLMTDIFQRPSPEVDGRTVTVADALDKAGEKLDAGLTAQPERLALLKETLAQTYENLGLLPKALELRRKVLEIRAKALGADAPATLRTMSSLVSALSQIGYYAEARELAGQEAALRKRVQGAAHPETLKALGFLAENSFRSGHHDEAIATARQVFDDTVAAYGANATQSQAAANALASYCGAAGVALPDDLFRKIFSISPPGSPDAQDDQKTPPTDAEHDKQVKEMVAEKRENLSRLRAELGPSHERVLEALGELATASYQGGFGDDAARSQEELVALCRDKFGEAHPKTIDAEDRLSYFYNRAWLKGPRDLRRDLIKRQKDLFGPEHLKTLCLQSEFALDLFFSRSPASIAEALAMFEEVVPLLEKTAGPNDRGTLNSMAGLARCYATTGNTEKAVELFEKCAPGMPDDTYINQLLACLQLWFGRTDDYNATRQRMIDYGRRNRDGFRSRSDILYRGVKISCLAPLENSDQGVEILATLRRADEICNGPSPHRKAEPGIQWRKLVEGMAQYRAGDDKEAESALREAIATHDEKQSPRDEKRYASTAGFFLAMCLCRQGDEKAAREAFSLAAEHMETCLDDKQPLLKSSDGLGEPVDVWLAHKEARAMLWPQAEPWSKKPGP